MGRGTLTVKIIEKAKEVFNEANFTSQQLRLLPYINNRLCDNSSLERDKIAPYERDIIRDWKETGLLKLPLLI